MAKVFEVPEMIRKKMDFCAGCGHGVTIRLVAECLQEIGEDNNVIFPIGVGCSSLLGGGLMKDRLHVPHGRCSAVATGMKRCSPDVTIVAYQGDGDAYNIGIAETLSAAYRNENFTLIVINNSNFGMTGGQMSATTLPGQKTSTTIGGRDPATTGMPLRFPELVASQFNVAYAARGSVHTPAETNKLKRYIKQALLAQQNKEGYSVVEVLSPCPTNWRLSPVATHKRIADEVQAYYPLGEFKKRGGAKE